MSWGWKPGADEFGPDVMVIDETDEDGRLHDTPRLAVEVVSTDLAADFVRRFRKYAAAGLPRYWIIDPEGARSRFVRATCSSEAASQTSLAVSRAGGRTTRVQVGDGWSAGGG